MKLDGKALIDAIEKALGLGPIPPGTQMEELLCWMKARRDDLAAQSDRMLRDAGEMPLSDIRLFTHVLSSFREGVELGTAIEILRAKKRLGAKQRQALELGIIYLTTRSQ